MSVLIFAESSEGKFKKAVYEAISYGKEVAGLLGTEAIVLCAAKDLPSDADLAGLGKYGASKVWKTKLNEDRPAAMAEALSEAAAKAGAVVVVISNNYNGKSISPVLAVKLQASVASGVVSLPNVSGGFSVRRGVFSGKAFADVNLSASIKVLAITPNTFTIREEGQNAQVEDFSPANSTDAYRVHSVSVNKVRGKIPLTEAELVVSGGRGMKGPENWGVLEELANTLGAATACSKPVADMDWRPHEEHVGQTGITIKPNLYIAVGISGAIQHLAGVSSSKVIVVINKDPESPFFKVADYGIVGDALEVLPKLVTAAKELKSVQ